MHHLNETRKFFANKFFFMNFSKTKNNNNNNKNQIKNQNTIK